MAKASTAAKGEPDNASVPDRFATGSPRTLAVWVVQQTLSGGRSLKDPLGEAQPRLSDPRQRALLQELAYGTLRWYPHLKALANALLKRPLKQRDQDLRILILIGLYQLLHTRVAVHAALSETVEVARELGKAWGVGLVNGVLRNFLRRRDALLSRLDRDDAVRLACPPWLLHAVQRDWPEDWEEILAALNQRPPMTLRVNRTRIDREAYLAKLDEAGLSGGVLSCAPDALILESPVEVQRLPGFTEGLVSVQDAGAQLAAPLLAVEAGQRVLDACAAPGGKTGHILECAPRLRELVAVDVDPERLRLVRDNLQRLSASARVCQGDAAAPAGDWAEIHYDRILLDVPCSATGVIRRHPDIKVLRRAGDIAQLVDVQARILDAIWPLLASGGRLVYATCSLLDEENHQQVGAFLERHPDARAPAIRASWGRARPHGRQTLPGESTMDGFYYACLEKA